MTQSSTFPANKYAETRCKPTPVSSEWGSIVSSHNDVVSETSPRDPTREVAESHSPGFLGSTSFVATIRANSGAEEPGQDEASSSDHIDKKSLDLGVKALMFFPNRRACFELNKCYMESYETGFHKPTIYGALQAFWDTFGARMEEPRKLGDIQEIATELTFNGRKPLERPDDSHAWLAAFTGTKTRWEILGTLFVGFAYACLSLPEKELKVLTGGADVDRLKVVAEMKESIETCIELCRYSLNNIVCSLLYRHVLLESVISGDTGEYIPKYIG